MLPPDAAVASRLASWLNAIFQTAVVWPRSTRTHCPSSKFHALTVPSREPVKSRFSCFIRPSKISPLLCNVHRGTPVWRSHTIPVASFELEIAIVESTSRILLTVPLCPASSRCNALFPTSVQLRVSLYTKRTPYLHPRPAPYHHHSQ
jgi:hypothetical protein